MIYDLDNKGGGQIIGANDNTQPALRVDSRAAGYPAIACISTASGTVVQISAISGAGVAVTASGGVGIDVDNSGAIGIDADTSSDTYPAVDARSSGGKGAAVIIGRTVCASAPTIAALKFLHPSCASAAMMEFAGGFISCTSVSLAAQAGSVIDYVIPVALGSSVVRGIPLINLSAITGDAKW